MERWWSCEDMDQRWRRPVNPSPLWSRLPACSRTRMWRRDQDRWVIESLLGYSCPSSLHDSTRSMYAGSS